MANKFYKLSCLPVFLDLLVKGLLTSLLIIFFTLIGGNISYSQIILPGVSSPTIQKITLLIAPLENIGPKNSYAKEFEEILKNDLQNAALFDLKSEPVSGLDGENINFQSLFKQGIDTVVKGQYKMVDKKIIVSIRIFDVWRERALDGRTYTASPSKIREAAHRFANLIMKNLTGIDGFFTSKIVTVDGESKRDLFIMDYDGFNKRRLTSHSAKVMSPSCSRDGRKIVFNSDKILDHDIYVLYLVPRLREEKERNASKPFILDQSAEWSPNGSRIAFSSKGDIYVSNVNGKSLKKLTNDHYIDVSPTWSPDGNSIAFVSDRSGSPQIYVMNADGKNMKRITSGDYNSEPAWSSNPKVNKIAYVNVIGAHSNIFTVKPDGSDVKQLTFGSQNEAPSWSPDGHFITFSSNQNVSRDIYIMYLNGENQRRLTKSGKKRFPTWCKR